ncbi:cyclin-domain-containing protein [Mortierella sp. GBAus27b]|nr:cyclin-domain-containing protein [Mortierella sp. GBAus27b]
MHPHPGSTQVSPSPEPTVPTQVNVPDGVILVPEYFHLADMTHLIIMIADMLGRLTAHNDQIPLTSANLTRFHSRAPPQISVYDYLRRIVRYTSLERACLLVILIYIDRVCERVRTFTISSLTVHRFIIASVTLAAKAVCDSYCTNSHYARVGGLSTQELNTLEVEFLGLIEWRVAVEGSVMQRYYVNLVRQHAQFEITESVPQPLSSASHAQNDDEQMGAADPQDEGDQVVAEPDYEEGLRDQWIPMGE